MTRPCAYISGDPDMLPLICLDFEASCLPTPGHESFPVEVGVASVATGDVRSWLIKPWSAWIETGFWDPTAERLHGLSIDRLTREGQDVAIVRQELAEAVERHIVLSDSAWHEATWAEILYDAPAPFRVENYEAVLYDRAGLPMPAFRDALRDAQQAALVRVPTQHRAGPDAHRLAESCRLLLQWGGQR